MRRAPLRGGSGATRSHAQRARHRPGGGEGCRRKAREHGEDGEHPPFDRSEHLGTLGAGGKMRLPPPPTASPTCQIDFKAILAESGGWGSTPPTFRASPRPVAPLLRSWPIHPHPFIAGLCGAATATGGGNTDSRRSAASTPMQPFGCMGERLSADLLGRLRMTNRPQGDAGFPLMWSDN